MHLIDYLTDKKIKQHEFGKKIGVHFTYICKICSFERTPSLRTALKIEQETGGIVSVQELLNPNDLAAVPARNRAVGE
jgi:transcriptional regulator with XRE-family HTH domain